MSKSCVCDEISKQIWKTGWTTTFFWCPYLAERQPYKVIWMTLLWHQSGPPGYHHHLAPESCPLTAFIKLWGFYDLVGVTFGLSNASAEFQRYTKNCLNEVRDKFAFPYLDCVLVYSDDFVSYVHHLRKVFQKTVSKSRWKMQIISKVGQFFRSYNHEQRVQNRYI